MGFFKISKIRGYLGDPKLDQKYDTFLWIKDFIIFSFKNFKAYFLKFLNLKQRNIIIFLVLFLTIFSNKFRKYLKLNIFILYLIIKIITLFRANMFYYEIYFDWLILLGLIIFFNNFKLKKNLNIYFHYYYNYKFIKLILMKKILI